MSYTEDQEILSLFSDDVSLWGQLHDGDVGLATPNKASKESKLARLDSFDALSPESGISEDDPLPNWMSEKVSLSAWLGDEEDIPMADLMTIPPAPSPKPDVSKAEELFNELLVEIGAPALSGAGEEQLAEFNLAPSPTSSLESLEADFSMEATPVQIPASPMASVTSEPTVLSIPPGGDLEAQALALLDAMGCMEFASEESPPEAQIITVTIPPSPDQTPATWDQHHYSATSPVSVQSPSSGFSDESSQFSTPVSSPEPTSKRTKSKPRLKNSSPIDKKARKRGQNKEAATRYRIKKRGETQTLSGELKGLEDKNKTLKDKVEGLSREIKYLKDLLIEVKTLKGQINTVNAD